MAPLIPLLIAGGALAFALTGKKAAGNPATSNPNAGLPGGGPASSTLPGAGIAVPPDVLKTIAAAFATANPTIMNAAADELDKAGFKAQAADLRAAALAITKATSGNVINTTGSSVGQPTGATQSPTVLLPGTTIPVTPFPTIPQVSPNTGTVIEVPQVVINSGANPKKTQAAQLALMLSTTKRGSENKDQVRAFQTANLAEEQTSQITLGKPGKAATDGLYGTTTALTMARVYGIVPPAPFYYPKNPTPAKKAYKAQMTAFGLADPQRGDEWAHASSSVDNM